MRPNPNSLHYIQKRFRGHRSRIRVGYKKDAVKTGKLAKLAGPWFTKVSLKFLAISAFFAFDFVFVFR